MDTGGLFTIVEVFGFGAFFLTNKIVEKNDFSVVADANAGFYALELHGI